LGWKRLFCHPCFREGEVPVGEIDMMDYRIRGLAKKIILSFVIFMLVCFKSQQVLSAEPGKEEIRKLVRNYISKKLGEYKEYTDKLRGIVEGSGVFLPKARKLPSLPQPRSIRIIIERKPRILPSFSLKKKEFISSVDFSIEPSFFIRFSGKWERRGLWVGDKYYGWGELIAVDELTAQALDVPRSIPIKAVATIRRFMNCEVIESRRGVEVTSLIGTDDVILDLKGTNLKLKKEEVVLVPRHAGKIMPPKVAYYPSEMIMFRKLRRKDGSISICAVPGKRIMKKKDRPFGEEWKPTMAISIDGARLRIDGISDYFLSSASASYKTYLYYEVKVRGLDKQGPLTSQITLEGSTATYLSRPLTLTS